MSRLDPAAALRAAAAAAKTMSRDAEVGNPKVNVSVAPPVGTGPEPPSDAERALAAAAGASPEHRAARETVVRDFYQNRMGLGPPRCAEDLQTMDLDQPVAVAPLAVSARLRTVSKDSEPGNFFVTESPGDSAMSGAHERFEVAISFAALSCTGRNAGQVWVIDDADRDHNLRRI